MIDNATLWRVVRQCSAAVVITDDRGVIEYVNPKFEAVTGYTAAEVVGQRPSILSSGIQPREFYAELWSTILAGKEWTGTFCNRRKDGSLFWEQASISAVLDEHGTITHFVAVKEDVTEKRAIEQALRAAVERFELAMRGSTDGLWDWNLLSNHVYYSPRWAEMLGYGSDQLDPSLATFESLIHPADRSRIFAAVHSYLRGDTPRYEVDMRMRHQSGHFVYILARGFAARDADGRPYRLVGTHVDITETRRDHQRLAALAGATRVLAEATTLTETLPKFLKIVGEAGIWTVGIIWGVDASAGVLRCLSLWHANDFAGGHWESHIRNAPLQLGEGAAGESWRSGSPVWITDEASVCPQSVATDLGLRGTFAWPVRMTGRIVAVVQFCARDPRPRDEGWIQQFATLQAHFGHVVVSRATGSPEVGRQHGV